MGTLLDSFTQFFGHSPDWIHDEGWPYGVRYEVCKGGQRLVATIAVDESEFDCELWEGDICRLRFSSVMAAHWYSEIDEGGSRLVVKYRDVRLEQCVVRIQPEICISWEMSWAANFPREWRSPDDR